MNIEQVCAYFGVFINKKLKCPHLKWIEQSEPLKFRRFYSTIQLITDILDLN